jgi:hypothetical protein
MTTACSHENSNECPPAFSRVQEILTGWPLLTEDGETENEETDGSAALAAPPGTNKITVKKAKTKMPKNVFFMLLLL